MATVPVAARVPLPTVSDGYASLHDMQSWARRVMETPPDFVIGSDYLRRWWIIPRNEGCNVYLHEILRSDDDRAMHDHPWDNVSHLLFGSYLEHTPDGSVVRTAGDIVQRKAADLHRLEVIPGERAISLFITGPKGWVHWSDFCAPGDSSQVGRGCGED